MALTDKLTAIADAIRGKTGKTAGLTLEQMPIEIGGISGGSGGPLQAKTAYPSHSEQIIAPDDDYYGLVSVTVKPVPRLPACVASVEEQSANVAETVVTIGVAVSIQTPSGVEYFYNHEQLPEIPADVVEEYPYLLIMRNSSRMRLVASTEKAYYHTTEDGSKRITVNSSGRVYRADVNTEAGGWVAVGFGTGAWFGVNGSGTYTAWWSNYDIPNGSADSEEIYFPASQPQTEQPADATHFYYNGVRLPVIPQTVRENYTNYWIYRNVSGGYYRLICSNSVWYVGGDPIGIRDTATIDDVRYDITDAELSAGGDWKEITAGNYYYPYEEDDKFPLWTVQNIMNGSADATEVYFYGTLAVPDPV